MSDESKQSDKKWELAGVCVPAGLFMGMGVGWAMGHMVPGLFIGLGAGLLGMVLVRLKTG